MRLIRLEISNYRSIKSQCNAECIVFEGLDCLVGPNNAGKSNVLRSIRYLLRGESERVGLHFDRDPSSRIEVKGYFEIERSDFDRLKIEEKREAVRAQVLPDGTFGVSRSSDDGNLQVLSMFPKEERLRPAQYLAVRDRHWAEKESGSDFRDRMTEEFPEIVPYLEEGRETNKSGWEAAYNSFVDAPPDNLHLAELPAPPKQGIAADLMNLLPEPLLIPAVKEVSEATKTTARAEFGGLLKAVSEEIQGELDEAIAAALGEVSRQLNLIPNPETGDLVDDRHKVLRGLERSVTAFVRETFEDHAVQFEFPTPRSSLIFDHARLWVIEDGFGRVPVEDVGEGVKRVLIFSLIRTLADVRHGRLDLAPDGEEDRVLRKPFLILYEEAELFLHPALQGILLEALRTLSGAGDQVIFTTHSPFMIPTGLGASVSIVRKTRADGTKLIEAAQKLAAYDGNARRRLLGVHHLSSYIFSDRAVLVEGYSDLVVLKKIATRLNREWDFDRQQIPVISVAGRDNLPVFRGFLRSIGIRVYVMTDLDAVGTVLEAFSLDERVDQRRSALLDAAGAVAGNEGGAHVNRDAAEEIVWRATWSDLFERLEDLHGRLAVGDDFEPGDVASLQRLLDLRRERGVRAALAGNDGDVQAARRELQDALLETDVLLLNADLEDYYPYPGGNKISAALEFDPEAHSPEELRGRFTVLDADGALDMERFLTEVFVK